MDSNPRFVWGWLYCDGNITVDSAVGCAYDRDVVRFAKLNFNLRYQELLDILYTKLYIDPNLFKLNVSHRFMNPTTRKYGVVLIADDDDVEFMFESLNDFGIKTRVELYIEKVPIGVCEDSAEVVRSKVAASSENTSGTNSSKSMQGWSGHFSSGSSSITLFISSGGSEANSRASSEFTDDDIPYYKSFDGSSMIVSNLHSGMEKGSKVHNPTELTKGMMFESKEKLMSVVKKVHISNHQEIKVIKSDSVTWEVGCKQDIDGCQWRLRARKRKAHNFFEIMDSKGPHTCFNQSISQDHRNLDSSHIAEIIVNLIAVDPTVSEKVLMAAVVKEVGYTPTRKKLRDGRKIASEKVYGSWKESYQELPLLFNILHVVNPGTHVYWHFKEHDLGQPISEVVRFRRVFWTFKPCVDAFAHCIPVLQIDGTHLYGKYRGVLLTATTIDGFNHLLPVAFAIVEGETVASWSWFMERLRKMVALERSGICVISDRHHGIISAMKNPNIGWCEPYGYHRFCVRHLAANFSKEFKKTNLRERVVALCNQLTEAKSFLHWNALVAAEPRAEEWFSEINPKQYALAYDEGKRFGIMTTNMAESWNNAIRDSRKLPVSSLVKALYYKLVSYFDQRRVEIQKQALDGNEFTKHANQIMNKWKERATGHQVTKVDRNSWVFEVMTMKHGQKGGKKQIVRLQEHTCTCNKWQTYHIPCSHVLACCANVGLVHTNFISEWYKLENTRKVYAGHFEPIPDKSDWPALRNFPTVILDESHIPKKPGRRKSTRYKNEMDYQSLRKGKGASSSAP